MVLKASGYGGGSSQNYTGYNSASIASGGVGGSLSDSNVERLNRAVQKITDLEAAAEKSSREAKEAISELSVQTEKKQKKIISQQNIILNIVLIGFLVAVATLVGIVADVFLVRFADKSEAQVTIISPRPNQINSFQVEAADAPTFDEFIADTYYNAL